MTKWFGLMLALSITSVAAAPVELNPKHPDSYTVVKGDTLWDIAGRFLAKPWRWPEIWKANPGIKNPNLIYPGDVVVLTYQDGAPRLGLQRGSLRGSTVKLSPRTRVTALERPIPTIPYEAIAPFLTKPRVVTQEEMGAAPYVVASAGEHLASGTGDRVYVRGLKENPAGRYHILRLGQPYRKPPPVKLGDNKTEPPIMDPTQVHKEEPPKKEDEILGYEALYVGEAKVEKWGDPVTTLKLERAERETVIGDRLLPITGERYEQNFFPHPPKNTVEGNIISIFEGVRSLGRYQVVALDLGAEQGMEQGTVLAVYQRGQAVRDIVSPPSDDTVRLPDEQAGILIVFRTYDRISYALVMEATGPLRLNDVVRNP
jgi:hypothetical protein